MSIVMCLDINIAPLIVERELSLLAGWLVVNPPWHCGHVLIADSS